MACAMYVGLTGSPPGPLPQRRVHTHSESGVCWRTPELAGPVDDGDHVHLSLVNLVDDAVRSFKNLSDSLAVVLGTRRPDQGNVPTWRDRAVMRSTVRNAYTSESCAIYA